MRLVLAEEYLLREQLLPGKISPRYKFPENKSPETRFPRGKVSPSKNLPRKVYRKIIWRSRYLKKKKKKDMLKIEAVLSGQVAICTLGSRWRGSLLGCLEILQLGGTGISLNWMKNGAYSLDL